MKPSMKIGILGDYDPQKISHPATNNAINHAAKRQSIEVKIDWLPTPSLLTEKGLNTLKEYDCLWASSGSPFKSMIGMLKGIQVARNLDLPFIGT